LLTAILRLADFSGKSLSISLEIIAPLLSSTKLALGLGTRLLGGSKFHLGSGNGFFGLLSGALLSFGIVQGFFRRFESAHGKLIILQAR
jgi:hypothetical protein